MNTNLSTNQIVLALYKSGIWDKRRDIFITNLSYGLLDYEADFVVLSKSGYLTEVEIKRSWEDFKADFNKGHTHNDPRIYKFYYCLPISIKEKAIELLEQKYNKAIPAILFYDEEGRITHGGNYPNRGGRRLFIEEQLTIIRLCSIRLWNLKEKYENL